MKKKYSIILSNNEYKIFKPYLRNIDVAYESSQYNSEDVYLSMYLTQNEYDIISELLEKLLENI